MVTNAEIRALESETAPPDAPTRVEDVPVPSPARPLAVDEVAELVVRFTYHPPLPGQPGRYKRIRGEAHDLALTIAELTPKSREQSLALTALEEAVFWANAAIARREER